MAEVSRGITSHVVTNLSVCVGAYNGSDHWDHCHRYCFEDSRPSGHWTTQDLLLEPFARETGTEGAHMSNQTAYRTTASLLEGLLLSYTYRAISASISFKRSSPVFSAMLVWRGKKKKSKSRIESKYVDLLVLKVRQPLIHDGCYFYSCYCSQVISPKNIQETTSCITSRPPSLALI